MLEKECFASDRMSKAQYTHYLKAPNALIYVAEEAKQCLATAIVLMRKNSKIARLYSLAVKPMARQRGLAKQLLITIEKQLLNKHIQILKLEVSQKNIAAIKLYQNLAYEIVGSYAGYYQDGSDAWQMRKTLILNETEIS